MSKKPNYRKIVETATATEQPGRDHPQIRQARESWPVRHPWLTTWIALAAIGAVVQVAETLKAPPAPAPPPPPPRGPMFPAEKK